MATQGLQRLEEGETEKGSGAIEPHATARRGGRGRRQGRQLTTRYSRKGGGGGRGRHNSPQQSNKCKNEKGRGARSQTLRKDERGRVGGDDTGAHGDHRKW